jgi:protein farnesyltransferase/geranylgeranyltransferase type-1 subunit alpha
MKIFFTILTFDASFTKSKISLAPNNDSAWNYFRGILNHTQAPFASLRDFVVPYTMPHFPTSPSSSVLDLENPLPSSTSELPCPAALEFLAEILEQEPHGEGIKNAVLVRTKIYTFPYLGLSNFAVFAVI